MAKMKFSGAAATVAALSLAGLVSVPRPAHAGFFEQLFGIQPQQSAPTYEPQPAAPEPYSVPSYRNHPVKKRVAVESTPVRQKTTDLMHDASLRPGDAIMMKDGIHVFEGGHARQHDDTDFVALDNDRDLSKPERARLIATDVTRNDPLLLRTTPDVIASGRSAAVANPISKGYRITDARGKSLRYVGP